jgi:hypothetical protein
MGRLGWGHLIVETNVKGRSIVTTQIISARRHAMSKMHNRLIVHFLQTWSLVVLVGKHPSTFYSLNREPIARQRYLTARRNVRSYFNVGTCASKSVMTALAAHAWKGSRLHVAVVELYRTACAIKALKSRRPVLGSAARLSIVADMNAQSAAVLGRRRPVNDRPQSGSTVAWEPKRMLSLSISVSEFVVAS